jgi:hypothetical protein
MALEKWLYDEVSAGREIDSYVHCGSGRRTAD